MAILLAHSTWGMPTVPIDVAVAHCAGLGFDGLEMTVVPRWSTDAAKLDAAERRRIRKLYDDHGIALCALSGNTPVLPPEPSDVAANLARFRSYLDLAAELQHPGERLTVSTTSGGAEEDWGQVKDVLVERFGALASHAERAGVAVAVETHVGQALCLPEQVLWILNQVNSPALTVLFDISHFNIRGIDIDEVVAQLAPHSFHTHVKDERGVTPNHEFLIPGEGEMDYVRYLKAMARAGYNGYVATEISVMVQRRPDYDPLAAATQSYQVLSRAFEEAGIARVRA
jgi:sugar phosphate isomerase/epimerase